MTESPVAEYPVRESISNDDLGELGYEDGTGVELSSEFERA